MRVSHSGGAHLQGPLQRRCLYGGPLRLDCPLCHPCSRAQCFDPSTSRRRAGPIRRQHLHANQHHAHYVLIGRALKRQLASYYSLRARGVHSTEQCWAVRTDALIILGVAKPVLAGEHPAHSLGTRHLHPFQVPVISQLCLRLAHLAAGMTGHTAAIPRLQCSRSAAREPDALKGHSAHPVLVSSKA